MTDLERLGTDQEFGASSQNSKVGGSSSHPQMVARVNIGQEAVILLRILSGSTCDNPEILGNEMLPNKVFREN